jgi:hypothetical protein
MKILSFEEYTKQWSELDKYVKNTHEIPCYFEYLQREVYYRDYLDLFLGISVETFEREIIEGKQTVFVKELMVEDESIKKRTCKLKNGEIRLIVDHAYPYKDLLGTIKKVKYILIGEAAPASGKFIYKDAMGSYITAPLRASGINCNNLKSFKRLSEFAKKGFLHVDLYPFAFNFEKHNRLREKLSADETLIARFLNSVKEQVETLANNSILDPDWDFCFVGPKLTSKALIKQVSNTYNKSFVGRSIESIYDINKGDKFRGSEDYVCRPKQTGSKLKHLPRNAKLTVIMGGTGPHFELIQRAMNMNSNPNTTHSILTKNDKS